MCGFNRDHPLYIEQQSDPSSISMHIGDPGSPGSAPGSPYSDQEGSSTPNPESDEERWGGGTERSEEDSFDNESPRGSDSDGGGGRTASLEELSSSDAEGTSSTPLGGSTPQIYHKSSHNSWDEMEEDSDAERSPTPRWKPPYDTLDGTEGDSDEERTTTSSWNPPHDTVDGTEGDSDADRTPTPLWKPPHDTLDGMEGLGSDVHFATLPNFLFVQPKPFDPEHYRDELEDEEMLEEERQTIRHKNTIRWRATRDEQGNEMRESNARIVRWSDGSMTLHLGNKVFDVCEAPPQGARNHLFIRRGTCLQGVAVFKTKLTFKLPHSTDGTVGKALPLAEHSSKAQKVKLLDFGRDPESQRHEMIKKEDERLRASLRREAQQRRLRMRQQHRPLSSSYLEPDRYDEEEDDREDEGIGLTAIKGKYKGEGPRAAGENIYSSDSDEDSDDAKARRLMKAKTFEEEAHPKRKNKRKAGGDGGAVTKRAKKSVIISDEEEDDE